MFINVFGAHERVECGLIRFLEDEPYPIPLESVSIEASIVHAVAQVELTQVFVNKEMQPIEAVYFFPIDCNGGVTHFHAELEGRTIQGTVKPQEEAKAQYDKAVAENRTAFLVDSKKPDIFKVCVGSLKPGAKVKVVIGYVTEVKNEKGSNSQRFFIPTTVAPPYIPPESTGENVEEVKSMKFSEMSPAPVSITINVSLQGGIKSISSPSHKVVVENTHGISKPNFGHAVISLFGVVTDMDRDFVLLITPNEVHAPRLYVEKLENSFACMTHLIPSFNVTDQKVELVFILDCSGSMSGKSIELAKRALTLFLHSAPVGCYFNIVVFGSGFKCLFPQSVKYDDGNLDRAVQHSKSLSASMGGTELLQPLKAVFNKELIPGYLRQVFVLTDGEIFNTKEVLGLIKSNSHSGRVFSIGIGDSCSHYLVEGLAEAGGGTSSFVTYNESIDAKVLQQLKNAMQPSLSDVRVNWIRELDDEPAQTKSQNDEDTAFKLVPEKIPPIYDGSQLLVFGLFENMCPTEVNIEAKSPDGPLSFRVQLDQNNNLGTGMIHKLAAIKLLRELEMKVGGMSNGPKAEALKKEIVAISCKQGISSMFTAFVAEDTSTSDKKADKNWMMQTRHVPSQYANGWHGGPAKSCGRRRGAMGGAARGRCRGRAQPKRVSYAARSGSGSKMRRGRAPSYRHGNEPVGGSSGGRAPKRGASNGRSSAVSRKRRSLAHAKSGSNAAGPSSTATNRLHDIVATQMANGSFPLNKDFANSIGEKLENLQKEAKNLKFYESAFATALALTYFTEKLNELNDSWELVEGKARKWLLNAFPNHAAILAAASKFIKRKA